MFGVKDYFFISIIVLLVGYLGVNYFTISKLEIDVKNGENAIVAYEALLKITPFETVVTERKEIANEEINASINDDVILDGTYRL